MAAQTSTHWTDNEEILDRYILGRVDPTDKRLLEEHLESCAQCREAVSRARDLVAGVRRLGRDELKARLARRLEPTNRSAVPWPHVISAAAVFVIAVGVTLYAFWTPLEMWYEESLTSTASEAARESAPVREMATEEGNRASRDDIALRNETLLEQIDRTKGEDQKIVAAPAPKAAAEAAETGREREATVVAGAASSVSAWIQGVVVRVEAKDAAKQRGAAAEYDARDRKKAEAADREAPALRRQDETALSQAVRTELRQQPLGALPLSQQKLQTKQDLRTVETLLEQTPEGLRLTLYLDEAVPDAELQAAEVYAVGDDSLVVFLPTQQIAYKIPSSIGNVQALQFRAK